MGRIGLRRRMVWLAVAAAVVLPATAQALPDRSIGVVGASGLRPGMATMDVPIQRVVGKSFVFLEKAPCDQGMGYPAFRVVATPSGEDDGRSRVGLAYSDFVGKELRVDAVEPLTCPAGEYSVRYTVVGDGTQLLAQTLGQAVSDIAPVDDMTWAKQRWLGRIIYPKRRSVETYDAASGLYGRLEVRMNEPLRVVDVIWGLSATKPLWLVVQRDTGEQGFIATAYSWTNVYSDWWSALRPWENALAETNLRYDFKQQSPTNSDHDQRFGARSMTAAR
jgi:hypothetical protein